MPAPSARRPVLHVVASGGLYGIERLLLSLLPALRASGVSVELASLNRRDGPGSETGEALAASGVPVHFLDPGRSRGVAAIPRLAGLARGMGARALHTHGYKAPVLAVVAAAVSRIPVVGTVHSEALLATHLRRYVRMEGWFLRRFRAVAAVSEGVRADLERRGLAAELIRVIPNGIPDPGMVNVGVGSPDLQARTVVYIGRLSPEKNVDVLLDAVARLRTGGLDVRVLVGGEGPDRGGLAERAAREPLAGAVELLGFQRDTYALLARANAFALPSRTEGIPMALLEAMAAGVPVVATAVGGIPTVVVHGREALLVPPGDAPALAAALERVLTEPALAGELRASARRRYLAEFTVGTMAARYATFYDQVLRER